MSHIRDEGPQGSRAAAGSVVRAIQVREARIRAAHFAAVDPGAAARRHGPVHARRRGPAAVPAPACGAVGDHWRCLRHGRIVPRARARVKASPHEKAANCAYSRKFGSGKPGRTYTIQLSCDSGDDEQGSSMAVVTVPHDMGNHNGSGKSGRSSTGATRLSLAR